MSRRRLVVIGFICLMFAAVVVVSIRASHHAKKKAEIRFALGMSEEDFQAQAGPPVGQDEYSENTWDVYWRKTNLNEYRISVLYEPDFSSSRLHPIERIREVKFELDQPKPYAEVLADLPEAISLCKSGCKIAQQDDRIIVAPPNSGPWSTAVLFTGLTQNGKTFSPATQFRLVKWDVDPFHYAKISVGDWKPNK